MAVAAACGCGEPLEAEDEQALAEVAERHVNSEHPELVGTLSPLELAGRQPAEQAAA